MLGVTLIGAGYGSAKSRPAIDESKINYNRAKSALDVPNVQLGVHNVGKIGLTITSKGTFGTGYLSSTIDPLTGQTAPSCQYPYPGRSNYLYAGMLWVGAIIGEDTLVSVAADGWNLTREMWPASDPIDTLERHSTYDTYDIKAVSEQDFIATYTDTVTHPAYVANDIYDGRPHIPLKIKITQRSYAWSNGCAGDFVIFDYSIKNIGNSRLHQVYTGFMVDGDVGPVGGSPEEAADDICGFKKAVPSHRGCNFQDTINLAWIADNDGRDAYSIPAPCPQGFDYTSVTGLRTLHVPSDTMNISFNWWLSNGNASLDFGPRMAGTPEKPFRDFGGHLGTPTGDRNKYYIMGNGEFDYDQLFTTIDHSSEGWLAPPANAVDLANGYDTRYLLSFGPLDIEPGESLPFSMAYIAGADFHTDCNAFQSLFSAANPEPYYNYLNFSNIGHNAAWASWIYDVPGYDTDGDAYAGKYSLCTPDSSGAQDTIYYEGDGIPDYKAVPAPPAPYVKASPRISHTEDGKIRLCFNGYESETGRDIFSRINDFEGYYVGISEEARASTFVIIAIYDKEDYNKYIYNEPKGVYELKDFPFTIDSLRVLYGGDFNPLNYDKDNPLVLNGEQFYFVKYAWNNSNLSDTNLIHKLYPDQIPPTTLNIDSARLYYPEELTPEGRFKYYEYEYFAKNLLPGKFYYIGVAAFDFGWSFMGVTGSVSSQSVDTATTPLPTDVPDDVNLPYVFKLHQNYPNPFNPQTEITYDLPVRSDVTLRIYNILGQTVRTYSIRAKPAGRYSLVWDGSNNAGRQMASGMYFYKITAGVFTDSKKMILLK